MEFDEVFKYIGDIGVYQIVLYVLLGLPSYYSGYQNIAMTFLGPNQDHWCEIPELVEFPFETQKYVGIPYNTEDEAYERCLYYDLPYGNYTNDEIWNWNWTTSGINQPDVGQLECDSWVYDQSEFVTTAVSEFDLVCDDSFLIALLSTIYLGGILVGAPISGALSDRFGRKKVLLGGCAMQLIFAVSAAFSPNYATFATLRFFTSIFTTFAYLTAFVVIMEVIGPKYRTLAGVFFQIWFAIGFMLLPGMAYFVRDFKNLQIVMGVPIIITVSFIFLVPESPRWLVAQERYDEANKILRKIAEINGREIPDKLDLKPTEEKIDKGKFTDLFTHPVLCREILIIYLGWLTNSLVYYGLSLNTGTLVGSVFLNTFISGSVEIPANIICIITMYIVGRKPTLAWSYIVAGLSAFLCIPFLENEDLAWLVTTLTMIGKAAITICFSSIYVYTAELFPTPVRHLAVGSSSMMSRVGGLVAPFMGQPLMDIWVPMPSVIFGVMGILSGLLTFLLPETLNRKLPDTIEDAEEIGRLGKKKKKEPATEVNGGVNKEYENKAYEEITDGIPRSQDPFQNNKSGYETFSDITGDNVLYGTPQKEDLVTEL